MDLIFATGIEIETGNTSRPLKSQLPETWTQGTDASAGLEYRSGKLCTVEDLFQSTTKICAALRNTSHPIHHKCGLHVHIGFKHINDLSAKYRLFRFVSVYEDLILDMHKPWPERAGYCKKLTDNYWNSVRNGQGFGEWETGQEATAGQVRSGRFWWFNGAAMYKHGTVEFRLMNGTLDETEILGWVSLLQCIFIATVKKDVKLEWMDRKRATPRNLIHDCLADSEPTFGQKAINFVMSHCS